MIATISLFADFPRKGTVIDFVDDAVVIKSDDGKRVTLVEDYRTYIPEDEEWYVGDKIIIRDELFSGLSLHRIDE
ncbi:MAG: hypothetical protein IJN69_08865 [Oscillospiraceae bacterium]|nr:hypothetical protein [Oscillospiraceae bacterium]